MGFVLTGTGFTFGALFIFLTGLSLIVIAVLMEVYKSYAR